MTVCVLLLQFYFLTYSICIEYRKSIMIVNKTMLSCWVFNRDICFEAPWPQSGWKEGLSVCKLSSLSLCGHKASVKPTIVILYKSLQNLYFVPEYRWRRVILNNSKFDPHFGQKPIDWAYNGFSICFSNRALDTIEDPNLKIGLRDAKLPHYNEHSWHKNDRDWFRDS